MLYIGANYHPHDWDEQRWPVDIALMKEAGFTTVRLGHLCWDSFEPEDGVYTFGWFDRVMDLFADAGIGVVLDVSTHPAPLWVHRRCPGCRITSAGGKELSPVRRYMEDQSDPDYQEYALRFARILVSRYRSHPALFAFGLCNEIGDGLRNYSEASRRRFIAWLQRKYGDIDALNKAWATRRWSRRLYSFEDVFFPETEDIKGAPEPWLDMRRFFADGIGDFIVKLKQTVEEYAPGVPHSSNHYAEKANLGFDYMNRYTEFVDYPGMGVYAGYRVNEGWHWMNGLYQERLAETDKPMWCLEYQTGGGLYHHGPEKGLYMMAMLSLLNRAQMILGWTWRTMLAGEEQYLTGLLDHDGVPNQNYREYVHIARDMKKLSAYAFPYVPVPEAAIACSSDNDWVIQYAGNHYRQSYSDAMAVISRVFTWLNTDYNVVNLKNMKHSYRLLILPDYVLMSEKEAAAVREFVRRGGTVIMTGYSAAVDEHNQAFALPRPGRLADVFGIRVSGYERPESGELPVVLQPSERYRILPEGETAGKPGPAKISIKASFCETVELRGAEAPAHRSDTGEPVITVNEYGSGRAYYVTTETEEKLLELLVRSVLSENAGACECGQAQAEADHTAAAAAGRKPDVPGNADRLTSATPAERNSPLRAEKAPAVPEGVQARLIAENQLFAVNTTGEEKVLHFAGSRKAVLRDISCSGSFTLGAYSAELLVKI